MRHHNANRKLGRETGQHKALLRSLARSLVLKNRITTTEAKAKEIRPMVEKLVSRGKVNTLSNRRMLIAALGDEAAAKKLIKTAEQYKTRPGGYLRITKLMPRKGDRSPLALIEFV